MTEPQMPVDPPKEVSHKRKPAWAHELIQDTERYGAPEGSLRKARDLVRIPAMWHYYQTSLMHNLPVLRKLWESKSGRIRCMRRLLLLWVDTHQSWH